MMKRSLVPIALRIVRRRVSILSFVAVLSVGLSTLASLDAQSLTWLGILPDGFGSAATGVSADGTVVVGWDRHISGNYRAFRWANGVMQNLRTLGGWESRAFSVSADGTVVVGESINADGYYRAFRWVSGVMQDLGTLGADYNQSRAYGVSADGTVVVGWAFNASGWSRAFRWAPTGGMEDLNDTYASLLTDGSYLGTARAISPDRRYIVGSGYNASTGRWEGFLLDTWRTGDTNGDGCIDDADLLAVLFAFGTPGTGYTRHEDINKDGIVDDADLLMVLFNLGSGC